MSCHTLGGPGTLPVLRDDLYRIPWTAKRGRVTQVEIVDAVYGHAVEERRYSSIASLASASRLWLRFGAGGPRMFLRSSFSVSITPVAGRWRLGSSSPEPMAGCMSVP